MTKPVTPLTRSTWLRATTLGWLLGVPVIILLSSLAESAGLEHSNTPVGAGMGLALGAAQWLILRRRLPQPTRWIAATTFGLAAPFLLSDLARVLNVGPPYSLYVTAAAGGVLAAVLQSRLVRPLGIRPGRWAVLSVIGWSLACASLALADWMFQQHRIHGIPGAIAYLALLCSGGLFFGIVSGRGVGGRRRDG